MPRTEPAAHAAVGQRARRARATLVLLGVALIAAGLLWHSMRGSSAPSDGTLQPTLAKRSTDGVMDERAALVETGGVAREASRRNALPAAPATAVPVTPKVEATWPLRVRVAAAAASDTEDLELDYGLNEIEGHAIQWLGAVPFERDGALHVAHLPQLLARRKLAVEVRSRARDLSSGIVHLGRPLVGDAVLSVSLREVGELVVDVRRQERAPGAGARSPWDGGKTGPELQIRRFDVIASASGAEVTPYGERVCAVERAPRLDLSHARGGHRYERVTAGTVRVEVEELRSHPAEVEALVRRGERLALTVALEPLALAGALSGTLVVEGAPIRNGLIVVARSLEDPTESFQTFATPMAGASPGERYDWRIEDLPAGDYLVVAMPLSFARIEPPNYTSVAPAEGLDFVVQNDASVRWCDWNVIDARSRAPLENVWVDLERRDGTVRRVRLDRAPAERFPESSDVRWTVRCAGYEPISGTLADCDRAEPRAQRKDNTELADKRMQEVWVCDLELNPADH